MASEPVKTPVQVPHEPVRRAPMQAAAVVEVFEDTDLALIRWALELVLDHCGRALRMTDGSQANSTFYATYPLECRDLLRERRSEAYELLKRLKGI